jgi:putative SOS response-associated peptidase YedK
LGLRPAPAEGIEGKPAFREAFQRRRCLVPVDNFYESKKTASGKQPYALALADRGIMALAGVRENWHSPAGEWVRSFAIITTTRNELCWATYAKICAENDVATLGISRDNTDQGEEWTFGGVATYEIAFT